MRRRTSASPASSHDAPAHGLVCRVCHEPAPAEQSVALWLEGALVFSICHGCMDAHDIVLRPGPDGVEVHAKWGARLQGAVAPRSSAPPVLPRPALERPVLERSTTRLTTKKTQPRRTTSVTSRVA